MSNKLVMSHDCWSSTLGEIQDSSPLLYFFPILMTPHLKRKRQNEIFHVSKWGINAGNKALCLHAYLQTSVILKHWIPKCFKDEWEQPSASQYPKSSFISKEVLGVIFSIPVGSLKNSSGYFGV